MMMAMTRRTTATLEEKTLFPHRRHEKEAHLELGKAGSRIHQATRNPSCFYCSSVTSSNLWIIV